MGYDSRLKIDRSEDKYYTSLSIIFYTFVLEYLLQMIL